MIPAGSGRQAQIVYFSHGGGPLPILGDPGHQAMVDFMARCPHGCGSRRPSSSSARTGKKEAATLLGAAAPPMFYDYYGFPEEAYAITYPAPGHPELAARIAGLLEKHDVPAAIDPGRGFDHGLFIPLKLMYPDADIPSLQLSLLRGLDAARHLALGRALRELLPENILVVGSGFSFHNMRAFSWQGTAAPDPANDAFQDWLIDVCAGPTDQAEREQRLASGRRRPAPATATRARSTCCRSTCAWAWRGSRPKWFSTTASWASGRSGCCGKRLKMRRMDH